MKAAHKRLLVVLVGVVAITGGVVFAIGGDLSNRDDEAESFFVLEQLQVLMLKVVLFTINLSNQKS